MLSEIGHELGKLSEGLRLKAYDDGYGNLTIGYGHTPDIYFSFNKDTIITEQKANELYEHDIQEAYTIVRNKVDTSWLNFHQVDALVDVAFQSGHLKNIVRIACSDRNLDALKIAILNSGVNVKDKKTGIVSKIPGCVARRKRFLKLFDMPIDYATNKTPKEIALEIYNSYKVVKGKVIDVATWSAK